MANVEIIEDTIEKFQNKYRTQTTRLRSWDYGWNGAYFVTICTQNRTCFFGEVTEGVMRLSEPGKIAQTCWQEIPVHFPFVQLGEYVIMPNHVHGIVVINKKDDGRDDGMDSNNVETRDVGSYVETQYFASLQHNDGNGDDASSPSNRQPSKNKFGPQSKNLASIIRGFKTGVTKSVRNIRPDFKWQPRYYDHIIRDERSYHAISEYIRQNPQHWQADKLYTE